jgi:dTDP-4-dehydrorhamnose reductase
MPIRIAVTGKNGQVVRALSEAAQSENVVVIPVGRPDLDLGRPKTVEPALRAVAPDIVVNAAAYTAVDQAEREPEIANLVNAIGAGAVAAAARTLLVPVIHLSTDYVFDGDKKSAYVEEDPPSPGSVYGATKLAGELAVQHTIDEHVILRTAWVYAPYGKNFVRTMIGLAQSRNEVRVVGDQNGCPTYAPDIANAIIAIARNLLKFPSYPLLRGVFHFAGRGETTWADFAAAIFNHLSARGLKRPALTFITSADYPTPAKRPFNSRLNCTKLARLHRIESPPWQDSLAICMERLISSIDQRARS